MTKCQNEYGERVQAIVRPGDGIYPRLPASGAGYQQHYSYPYYSHRQATNSSDGNHFLCGLCIIGLPVVIALCGFYWTLIKIIDSTAQQQVKKDV